MFRPVLFSALLGLAVTASAEGIPAATDGLMVSAIDPSVPPCENFYLHACKGWLTANPIPPDQARWGVDDVLVERNREKLRTILEKATASPDTESRRIGDFWAACMDEAGIEARGLAPLQPELDRIDALTDKAELAPFVAHLHRIGVDALFGFGSDQDYADASQVIAVADQGGLGLPERKYYLNTGKDADATRAAYVAHLGRLFALAGTAAPDAAAASVMALETRLAQTSLSDVQRRDPTQIYHKLPVSDLDKLAPGFTWAAYLREVGAPPVSTLNIAVPDFFQGIQTTIAETPLDAIKFYLRAHLLHHAADMLPKRFIEENFDFFGKTLAGAKELKPRWKRCVSFVDAALGEDLGRIYVREAFGPDAKASIAALVKHLRTAYAADIKSLPWMGKETKAKADAKLNAMVEKIGYPDKWRDYSKLDIKRDDALGNHFRAATFENDREFAKIGKPVDKGEWQMTPPTVNAYYDPQKNDINFPAGILQPPNFDARWDDATNYGAIGAVIGHEMTHGFDDEGRQFDGQGNLKDWWSKNDTKQFKARAACLVAEYGGFGVGDGVKLDGNLTLGENTADNGGTRLAYRALKQALAGKSVPKRDGYTPEQRFFLAYAQSWCENQTPEGEKLQALTDPHSTSEYRVNGVVTNMPEFREAFRCKAGAPMAPKKSCRVW
ncbi:MAG: putative endopeptidase [Aliidongia sp.]|jgi:endothelin-converting enzyme/putative endopeptidase|nr:putative endopeptidase [Aliidongia sp.]